VVLAREGARGVEVLLVRRPIASRFAADAWVFPGGAVDPEDRDPALGEHLPEGDLREWTRRLALDESAEALGYLTAAVRETWEETGILIARTHAPEAARAARTELLAGAPFAELLDRHRLRLAFDRLAYIAHWITPTSEPRRYDARFFLAAVGEEAVCELVGEELVESRWFRPADAVEELSGDRLRLLPPTIHTLQRLSDAPSLADLWHAMRDAPVRTVRPRMRAGGESILDVEWEDE
jgi:8-oxo-dGTP pyrophosphatase MutT (NUDIX family)